MRHHWARRVAILAVTGALLTGCASPPSMLAPQGPQAARAAWLTWLMLAFVAAALGAITVLLIVAFVRAHRDGDSTDLYAHDRTAMRWMLLAGGLASLVTLAAAVFNSLPVSLDGLNAGTPTINIEVIAHQWWWEVHYTDRNLYTANEIHIPAGQPVSIHVTSADVIHSLWIPQLRGNIDAIPGQTTTVTLQADTPGIYRGQCAELCGEQHANMAFLVIADPPQSYQAWLADQQKESVEPKVGSIEQMGQQAFLGSACTYCHTISGTNATGRLGPDLTHIASRMTIGSGILPNNRGNLAGWIINSQGIKPGNHMPPMDLTSEQLQALLDYMATLK